ncbi:phosphodiester glycosidase family protein [Gorillibacterium timonense]|uniref:phosphodiester glycosidase family protein n=1 Tax=Gorillibacterium timonense TaxID=1689269 RepID=UPI000A689D01|nr:stalk domain-containing protein [Gorillibacterium timonense]
MLGNGSKKRWTWKQVVNAGVAVALMVPTFTLYSGRAEAASTVTDAVLKGNEPITAGANLLSYVAVIQRGTSTVKTNVKVVQVDMQVPYVQLGVMSGEGNSITTSNSVRGMAEETSAVAGINGDVYNTSSSVDRAPMGGVIQNGEILTSPSQIQGMYSFAVTKDNKPVIDLFTFQGSVTGPDGESYPLSGLNKNFYVSDPGKVNTMVDSIQLYTDKWASTNRGTGSGTTPTEVLVQNGVVQQISEGKAFNMVPPKDGYILRAHGKGAKFVLAHLLPGEPVNVQTQLVSTGTNTTYTDADLKTLMGGHTILVDEGKVATFSRDISGVGGQYYRARTAVGFSKDQRYVYMVTADKTSDSAGMSLAELQQFLVKIGAWKALNMDGGGSTQLVSRPLGETELVVANTTENGDERRVVNGLGVYTTAPKGNALSISILGEKTVFLNEKLTYEIKGYDTYYNPMEFDQSKVTWSSSGNVGSFQGNTFTVKATGTTIIKAVSGQAAHTMDVKVAARDDIASMSIVPTSTVLMNGSEIGLSVLVKLKDGTERTLPASSFKWETSGFKGQVSGSSLKVTDAGTSGGQLIAGYDGFRTILPMASGTSMVWSDFSSADVPASVMVYPQGELTATVDKVAGLGGLPAANTALQLQYDMTPGTFGEVTKAAYVKFGTEPDGVQAQGSPQTLSVNVLGDNSLNMLRAEVVDAAGTLTRIDLAERIDWTGWKTLTADLTKAKPVYPIKLKRIYVANPAVGQDERARTGAIGIDDITFQYKANTPALARNKVTLTLGKTTVQVNGKTLSLSPAPAPYTTKDGRTMVPVRFITEALGGSVVWTNATKQVSIQRGSQLADLWVGNKEMIIDGKRVVIDSPAELKGATTMVPLRVLSEAFQWKVNYDPATKSITLE